MKITLTEFRTRASEFIKALPALKRAEQIDSGFKMLCISFLAVEGSPDVELAEGILDYASRHASDASLRLHWAKTDPYSDACADRIADHVG